MEDEELDISWIQEQEQLLNVSNYQISPLYQIPIHIVYVSKQGVIETKETIQYTLPADATITHPTILLLKQQYNRLNYECIDVLYYHFQIQPEHVQDYVTAQTTTIPNPFLKTYNGENGIHFSPIIKLFHLFTSMYLFFREMEMAPPPLPPKPILKIGGSGNRIGNTKKVKIVCDAPAPEAPVSNRHKRNLIVKGRKTRKHTSISPT